MFVGILDSPEALLTSIFSVSLFSMLADRVCLGLFC